MNKIRIKKHILIGKFLIVYCKYINNYICFCLKNRHWFLNNWFIVLPFFSYSIQLIFAKLDIMHIFLNVKP